MTGIGVGIGIGIGVGLGGGTRGLESRVMSISGRIAWLRADRGVTETGGRVSSWVDTVAASGLSVSASVADRQPTLGTGGAGGCNYLLCGQTTYSYMTFATRSVADLAPSALEAFFVFRRDSAADTAGRGGLHSILGTVLGVAVPYTDNKVYDGFYASSRWSFPITAGITANDVCLYNPSSVTGDWSARINGAQVYQTAASTYAPGINNGILAYQDGTYYLQGKFYELLLFNRTLTDAERTTVNDYVRKRYAASW